MNVLNDIDTGVAALPAARPSTFSPSAFINGVFINRPLDIVDYATATNPAPIFNNVDDVTNWPVVASPGY